MGINDRVNNRIASQNNTGQCEVVHVDLTTDEFPGFPVNDALIEVALKIAEEHKGYLEKMRTALEEGDKKEALTWARKLCGLDDKQENAPAQLPEGGTSRANKTRADKAQAKLKKLIDVGAAPKDLSGKEELWRQLWLILERVPPTGQYTVATNFVRTSLGKFKTEEEANAKIEELMKTDAFRDRQFFVTRWY